MNIGNIGTNPASIFWQTRSATSSDTSTASSIQGSSPSAAGSQSSATSPTTYNFANVTNAQFLQEIQSLGQQGELSPNQQVLLTVSAEGGDSVPINGQPQSTSEALSDPTTHDFIAEYEDIDYQLHHTPGSVGAPLIDSILQTMQAYQGKPIAGSSSSVSVQS
jgi:hypothetical protein